jgi:hypothetical protein
VSFSHRGAGWLDLLKQNASLLLSFPPPHVGSEPVLIKQSLLIQKKWTTNQKFVLTYPSPRIRVVEEASQGAAHEAVDVADLTNLTWKKKCKTKNGLRSV